MKKYIIRRLIHLLPILIGITVFSFLLMNIGSSDFIDVMESRNGRAISETEKEQLKIELGLDKPLSQQYLSWLKGIVTGDMGESFVSGKAVFSTFISKLPATIYLTIATILLTVCISIPLGIVSAIHQNKLIDYLIRFFSFIGNSMPSFFVSLLLIYLFSLKLDILPVISQSINIKSVILPTLTLSIAMISKYTRQIRTIVLEELHKNYVIGARARGITEKTILCKSVLKSVMITITTLLALSIGSLLGGTAIVESIFMWDGVGKMAVDAIMMKDYPIIQAYVIWMAIIYVIVNLLTDILHHYLDPRIRLQEGEL